MLLTYAATYLAGFSGDLIHGSPQALQTTRPEASEERAGECGARRLYLRLPNCVPNASQQ
jgi:hypothetical protein